MAALLLQWLVLEHIAQTHHRSVLARYENKRTCSCATRMSPKSKKGARLVRALALCQRISHAAPMVTLYMAGKGNDVADVPSRSFRPERHWNFPTNEHLLSRFSTQLPLLQGNHWQIFLISPKIITRVISELLIVPSGMEGWIRLPVIDRVFGTTGSNIAGDSRSRLIHTSTGKILKPSLSLLPALLDGSGRALSDIDVKSFVLESRQISRPSIRTVSWIEGQTLCTEHLRNT